MGRSPQEPAGIRPTLGLAVGVAGAVEEGTGRAGPDVQNIPELGDFPLGAVLRERTGLRVAVDNDVNALALAGRIFGQGRGLRYLAMVAVGTEVGGGLMLYEEWLRDPARSGTRAGLDPGSA